MNYALLQLFARCNLSNLQQKLLTFEVFSPAETCAPRGQAVVLRRWQRIKDAVANGASDDAGTCPHAEVVGCGILHHLTSYILVEVASLIG